MERRPVGLQSVLNRAPPRLQSTSVFSIQAHRRQLGLYGSFQGTLAMAQVAQQSRAPELAPPRGKIYQYPGTQVPRCTKTPDPRAPRCRCFPCSSLPVHLTIRKRRSPSGMCHMARPAPPLPGACVKVRSQDRARGPLHQSRPAAFGNCVWQRGVWPFRQAFRH